jgi:hypothetical protein
MVLPAQSEPTPLIQFRNHFFTDGRTLGRVISPSQGLYLNTGQHKQNKRITHQIFMPWVGFEPTIPESERAKTVHVLDSAATVTGWEGPVTGLLNKFNFLGWYVSYLRAVHINNKFERFNYTCVPIERTLKNKIRRVTSWHSINIQHYGVAYMAVKYGSQHPGQK